MFHLPIIFIKRRKPSFGFHWETNLLSSLNRQYFTVLYYDNTIYNDIRNTCSRSAIFPNLKGGMIGYGFRIEDGNVCNFSYLNSSSLLHSLKPESPRCRADQ